MKILSLIGARGYLTLIMDRSKGPRRTGRNLSYSKVRETIQTGDVMLFKGKGPLSWIIRKGSASDYSHCGIASWEDERLMIYHSVFKGVGRAPASEAVEKYDGQVDWWSVRPQYAPDLDREAIVVEASKHVGKPFATFDLFKLMWLMLIGSYRGTPDPDNPPKAMFCSWYVSRSYRLGGPLDLVDGTEDACTSPAMLQNSELLMLRGILHDDPQGKLEDEPATEPTRSSV